MTSRVTTLLHEFPGEGYPTPYLLARLAARRGLLTTGTSLPSDSALRGTDDEAIWRGLLRELRWTARQLNPSLRIALAPALLYFQLRPLFLCLRFKASGELDLLSDLLSETLLAPRLRRAILSGNDWKEATATVIKQFEAAGIPVVLEAPMVPGGPGRDFEQALTASILVHFVKARGFPPFLTRFFSALVDSRNLLAALESRRWEQHLPLLPGGEIPLGRIRKALKTPEGPELENLLQRWIGPSKGAPGAPPESRLLTAISSRLRPFRRGSDGAAALEYLWACHLSARNRSLLLQRQWLNEESMATEMAG